jgi:hypothetical protein
LACRARRGAGRVRGPPGCRRSTYRPLGPLWINSRGQRHRMRADSRLAGRRECQRASPLFLIEIFRIGRLLPLPGRHQKPVRA